METIYTAIITGVVTVFGSGAAWTFYEKRMRLKHKTRTNEKALFRNELMSRIGKLEKKLKTEEEKNDELQEAVKELSITVATLSTRIEYINNE
jgi:hypothetical protein